MHDALACVQVGRHPRASLRVRKSPAREISSLAPLSVHHAGGRRGGGLTALITWYFKVALSTLASVVIFSRSAGRSLPKASLVGMNTVTADWFRSFCRPASDDQLKRR